MPREKLRELIVGAAAAVATPFDENYEVDLGKMYDPHAMVGRQWTG